jgi:N-methylhydantoinase B
MPEAVKRCLEQLELGPGDVALVNDPYQGGTHLPDITLVSPVWVGDQRLAFVANRAHHADIGGMTPGSMPIAEEVFQEGLILPPVRIARQGAVEDDLLRLILANVRTPGERLGDLRAQLAANRRGVSRMEELIGHYGSDVTTGAMEDLRAYAERMTRRLIAGLPPGTYRFEDQMDDDGLDPEPAILRVAITLAGEEARVDFAGTSSQRRGGINAVLPITIAAVAYVFRCLVGLDIPANSGCLAPIQILAAKGSLVNPSFPAAVAAGNVETSQRIVDVLLGALAQACPDRVPAASQGTMNNLTIGGWDPERGRAFTYYETIGGGMGARPGKDGASAIQTHMTNTLNTPVEALEFAYPLRIRELSVRRGSGGKGRWRGGDGTIREIELLAPARVTILSERRASAPYGLGGGHPALPGRNILIRGEKETSLPAKTSFDGKVGDVVRVETPGGGGLGRP